MNNTPLSLFVLLALGAAGSPALFAEEPAKETRTIHLLQDDAQPILASKLYELKYVKATDVRPFVEAAVKRYCSTSKVERVNYPAGKQNFILVSTGNDFIPYMDDLIAKIDRPGKADQFGSVIEGTGITRIAYTPNYRAAEDIVRILNDAIRSPEGVVYLNKETNTIYWKDDDGAAKLLLAWAQRLDRPVPQVNLRLNYYEVRESTLRDVGLDYLAWKNGPGLNLFEAAYNGGNVFSNESILNTLGTGATFVDAARDFSTSWGYGGFFTAPQFDLSFIRVLQQSGNAKLIANTNLTFVNTAICEDAARSQSRTYTAALTPDYQNIRKDADDRTYVERGSIPALELTVKNPVICFGAATGEVDTIGSIPSDEAFYAKNNGGVVFNYSLLSKDIVERNNRGDELGHSSYTTGNLTLGFKTEKLLSSHVKETETEETIGIPFLIKIPVLKYLFGTTTTIHEKVYIVVTAEANLVHPELLPPQPVSPDVIAAELN